MIFLQRRGDAEMMNMELRKVEKTKRKMVYLPVNPRATVSPINQYPIFS
jgi:hypothetical protein